MESLNPAKRSSNQLLLQDSAPSAPKASVVANRHFQSQKAPHRLSDKMVAHVFSHAVIANTGLECNTFSDSLSFGCNELAKAASGDYNLFAEKSNGNLVGFTQEETNKLKKMQIALEKCKRRQKTYSELASSSTPDSDALKKEVSKLQKEIQKLSDGEALLLPGGWCGIKQEGKVVPGHAMLYEVVKLNDSYQFTLFNSGKGLQTYHRKEGDKMYCSQSFLRIPQAGITSNDFLTDLLKLRCCPGFTGSKEPEQFLYETALNPLVRYANQDPDQELLRAEQPAQTCTWECQTLWFEKSLGNTTYQKLHKIIQNYTLIKWIRQNRESTSETQITDTIAKQIFADCISRNQGPGRAQKSGAKKGSRRSKSPSLNGRVKVIENPTKDSTSLPALNHPSPASDHNTRNVQKERKTRALTQQEVQSALLLFRNVK